jgi:hypothetical protein
VALAKLGISTGNSALLKRAIASYLEARTGLKNRADPELEPLLVSNVGDAYRNLAQYEDRDENLARARNFLVEALKFPALVDYAAIQGEILFKLGQVDVAIGRAAENPTTERGVQEWACSYDIFVRAGRASQANTVLYTLRDDLPIEIVERALDERAAPLTDCHWDAPIILRQLSPRT